MNRKQTNYTSAEFQINLFYSGDSIIKHNGTSCNNNPILLTTGLFNENNSSNGFGDLLFIKSINKKSASGSLVANNMAMNTLSSIFTLPFLGGLITTVPAYSPLLLTLTFNISEFDVDINDINWNGKAN